MCFDHNSVNSTKHDFYKGRDFLKFILWVMCALWWLLLKVQLPKSKPFLSIHPTGLSCSIQRKLWVLSLAFYGFEQKKTQRHRPTSVDSCQQLHLCTSYKHTILEEYLWDVSLEKKLQTLTMSVITLYFGKCNAYFWLHEAFECVISELISPK